MEQRRQSIRARFVLVAGHVHNKLGCRGTRRRVKWLGEVCRLPPGRLQDLQAPYCKDAATGLCLMILNALFTSY